ncbi:copper chaperone PCu(A)C [Actinoplanes sp. NPDC051859]|uniref:copper chaperone PCu(A)C n=1 Tax=Actinoplanes sp. NPDC051859 TaxID=3363909 RepID=UPI0037AA6C0D
MSNMLQNRRARTRAGLALAALTVTALTGCGGDKDAATPTATGTAAPASSAAAVTGLVVRDPWVKAADKGMTAGFAELVNDSDADITIKAATSPASPIELHTMAMKDGKMVMMPKEGGFVIKARSSHKLAPGGDHLMLMKPAAAIKPGDEVSFTLELSSGNPLTFKAIAKPFAGAGESYDPGMKMPSASAHP